MKPLSAIVLCAGQGTRMKSAQPKVLHPVLGRPLVYYPLSLAFEVGASPVVAVVGHQAAVVESEVKGLFPDQPLRFAVQASQLGTAHAVRAAEEALAGFAGDLLIIYGDVPLLRAGRVKQLLEVHRQSKDPLTLVTFRPADSRGYGRILRAWDKVQRIVEDQDASDQQRTLTECNAGIYVADSAFLWAALRQIEPHNAQGEFYLTDLVEIVTRSGATVATVEAKPEEVAGVNDRRGLASAAFILQGRINAQHQIEGVTMLDPGSVSIDAAVRLAPDVELGINVVLHGDTRIGTGSTIGAGCVITDSVLGAGVEVKPYSVIERAKVGDGCVIGPFAHVRGDTELGKGVHVGNFVETDGARMGAGSSASHLTYLGDTEIGAGVKVEPGSAAGGKAR